MQKAKILEGDHSWSLKAGRHSTVRLRGDVSFTANAKDTTPQKKKAKRPRLSLQRAATRSGTLPLCGAAAAADGSRRAAGAVRPSAAGGAGRTARSNPPEGEVEWEQWNVELAWPEGKRPAGVVEALALGYYEGAAGGGWSGLHCENSLPVVER